MRSRRFACPPRIWVSAACALAVAFHAPVAAQESDGDLRLMREPSTFLDVADAADGEDPFDINLTVGFLRTWTFGNIQRERAGGAGEDPNRRARLWDDVARHEHVQNILELGLDVGVLPDLMVYGRMPIILSDDRSLSRTRGRDPAPVLAADDTVDRCAADAEGDCMPGSAPDGVDDLEPGRAPPPLFEVPEDGFASPTRSGLDYIAAGLAWSIFNQNRDSDLPTWLLMIEGRFNVGEPLVACGAGAPCRRWVQNGPTWTPRDDGDNAGMTRGTNALRIETRASWRTRYVEPYAGVLFHIEWPGSAERFYFPAGNLSGIINERPPILGTITGGMAVIPWENRGGWQRFTIDLRFTGTYVSEGHGYSPLFDALGTSRNRYLAEPNLEGDGDVDSDLREVPFFGLTDMQSHAELGARVGLELQAARYVKFALGANLFYISPYLVTFTDACNPGVQDVPSSDPRRGTCRRGIINPNHRPVIDLPGQRFRVDEQVRLDLFVNATAQF